VGFHVWRQLELGHGQTGGEDLDRVGVKAVRVQGVFMSARFGVDGDVGCGVQGVWRPHGPRN